MKNATEVEMDSSEELLGKITPLPWRVGKKHPTRIFTDRESVSLRQKVGATCLLQDDDSPTQQEIVDAAYIVQCANLFPELLAALRDCVKLWDVLNPEDTDRPTLNRARAIISKAADGLNPRE